MTHKHDSNRYLFFTAVVLLLVVTAISYMPALKADFVNYDDPLYVTAEPMVQKGLTWEGIAWAFTTFDAFNWHPLTWLSHMADVSIFGLDPSGHHAVNLILHLLNTLLVFLLFLKLTANPWQALLISALFALHPLHVESVAWVAERKDVLSTALALASFYLYLCYTESPTALRFAGSLSLFAASLMAKPMYVTLPCLYLVLDIWPLKRWTLFTDETVPENKMKHSGVRLVVEKIPFFLMTAGSSVLTYLAQKSGGSVSTFISLPLVDRLINALVAYSTYLLKAVWPTNLAVFYPHPGTYPPSTVVFSALVLMMISVTSVLLWRRNPSLMVGWLWFIGTLVPVIGIVQVGHQALADRYTYFPLLGIFWIAADIWSTLADKYKSARPFIASAAVLIIGILAIITYRQSSRWVNNLTLFQHAISVTQGNYVAHTNLGNALAKAGDHDQAIHEFKAAIAIHANYQLAYENLGEAYIQTGQLEKAIEVHRRALMLGDASAGTLINFGAALINAGFHQQAIIYLKQALILEPTNAEAYINLGAALAQSGRLTTASDHFAMALQYAPDRADARENLDRALSMQSDLTRREKQVREALKRRQEAPFLWITLGQIQLALEDNDDAIHAFQKSIALMPGLKDAYEGLAIAYDQSGDTENAIRTLNRMVLEGHDDPEIRYRLAAMYARAGHLQQALNSLEMALINGFRDRNRIIFNPDFDGLRESPRYQQLIDSLNTG